MIYYTGTKNSEVEYTLFGEMKDNFTIDSVTGVIRPNKPLDFELVEGSPNENVRTIHFIVRGRDWGTPSLYSDVSLLIYLQDVNDNIPKFENTYYNASIPEIILGGSAVLQVKFY